MSLVKREKGERKLNKVVIDLCSELTETCLDTQEKVAKNKENFRQQLKHNILVLKNEIDHASLMSLKELEAISQCRHSEIDQLQALLNDMIREIEIYNHRIARKE